MIHDFVEAKIRQLERGDRFGKFLIEPLEKGYGVTLGNSLRRVLLSSIQGAAIATVKIEGVLHEFSTIPGMVEDVTELILNLKELSIRVNSGGDLAADQSWTLRLSAQGKGEVTGADIELPPDLEMCSPEVHLATLTQVKAKLELELTVERGIGFVPAQRRDRGELPIGCIPIDAIYTPIRRINYVVEPTRLGQKTDYDRLVFEVWTNGTVEPAKAISDGAKILTDQLKLFFDFTEREEQERQFEEEEARQQDRVLEYKVEDMDFSVRTYNCLRKENIDSLGQLILLSEDELMKIRNFGRKSLNEVIDKLGKFNLHLKASLMQPDDLPGLDEDEFAVELEIDEEDIV